MSNLHRIVIVGGGVAGLELATLLGNSLGKAKKAHIVLVDQKLTHIWKPLLHEVAAGSLNPHEEETNYFVHASKHHYEFVFGRLNRVDSIAKKIVLNTPNISSKTNQTTEFSLAYDTLVLALGSVSHDFNISGVRDFCYFLDHLEQAKIFQHDLLHLYLDAQYQSQKTSLNIAIIGAGATGVELAAELIEVKKNFFQYGLNKIDPKQVKITLIEASERILPALSERISRHTHQQLNDFDISILTQHKVTKVDAQAIYFSDGARLPADVKVWTAGIKAPDVIAEIPDLEKDALNRLKVYATLQTLTDPNIFALGDCAHCQPTADSPVLGPRAQVASQQAAFLATTLKEHIQQRPLPMFKFSEKGSLVSLSHNSAVGELLGQVNVQGFVAKSMYVSLYRLHQATIHGYTQAGLLTAKDFVTRKIRPRLKLH